MDDKQIKAQENIEQRIDRIEKQLLEQQTSRTYHYHHQPGCIYLILAVAAATLITKGCIADEVINKLQQKGYVESFNKYER